MQKLTTLLLEGKKTDTICVFDVDDTLLFSSNKIGYKTPDMDKFVKIGTEEFAELRLKLPKDTQYDYSEFREFEFCYMGIKKGSPHITVLKMLDEAIHKGYKIGIITARGNQNAVWKALNNFLLYRNKNDELVPLPKGQFNQQYVFSVSDPKVLSAFKSNADPSNPSKLKAYILQNIFGDTYGFKNIIFYDDDQGNIDAVKGLNDKRILPVKV